MSSQQAERAPWPGRCDWLHCRCCDGWPDRDWRLVRADLRDEAALHAYVSNSQASFRRRYGGSSGAPCQFRIGAPCGVKTGRRSRRPQCFCEVAVCTGAGVAFQSHREIVRITNRWLLPDLMHYDTQMTECASMIDDQVRVCLPIIRARPLKTVVARASKSCLLGVSFRSRS